MQKRTIIILISLGAAIMCALAFAFIGTTTIRTDIQYGFTWSDIYARSLNLNPSTAFEKAITELKPSIVRIPAYWNEIEPSENQFSFDRIKQQLSIMDKHGAMALIVLGQKQPRWPECWLPDWARILSQDERDIAQKRYVSAVLNELKDEPAIYAWQIENEPTFFSFFGECKTFRPSITHEEFEMVKKLEEGRGEKKRLIITTVSGELSTWAEKDIRPFDAIGTSIYRKIKSPQGITLNYRLIPPLTYKRKATIARLFHPSLNLFVSEFQMEPWVNKAMTETPIVTQLETLDENQMEQNLAFAQRLEMPTVLFWGAEWWMWMDEKHQQPQFWNRMKRFFQETKK